MARPASGQLWPRFESGGGGGGGGDSFPDDPDTFTGSASADDEEWDNDISAWTFDVTPTSPNALDVNTLAPSRLVFKARNTTGDSARLYKAATINMSSDISVTFDASGIFDADFKAFEVGFRQATGTSDDGITALIHNTTIGGTNALYLIMRKYTNIQSGTFTELQSVNYASSTDRQRAVKIYMHLQRVSNVWSAWYSADGVSWQRIGSTSTDSVSLTHAHIAVGGFGAAVPYNITNNWIRYNRFFIT